MPQLPRQFSQRRAADARLGDPAHRPASLGAKQVNPAPATSLASDRGHRPPSVISSAHAAAMASSSQVPDSQASGAVVAAGTEGDDVVHISDGEEEEAEDGSGSKRKLRSDVWNGFVRVTVDGVRKARCKHCDKKLSAVSRNGTTHLKTHLKSCPYNNKKKGDKIQTNLRFGGTEKGTVAVENYVFDQEVARKALYSMIILHEYPLSIVDHHGFRKFVSSLQPLFKMGTRNTIRRDIMHFYEGEKRKARIFLQRTNCRVAVTTDLWTADNQKRGYMAVTGHFIDDSWTLKSCILRFMYVPCPHTAEVICDALHKCLQSWDIDRRVSTVTLDNCSTNDSMVGLMEARLGATNMLLKAVSIDFIKSWNVASIPGIFFCLWYAAKEHCLANNVLGISSCIQGINMLSLGSFKAGAILLLVFPTADAGQSFSITCSLGNTVIPGIFVALALCIALLPKHSKNRLFNCALRYTVGLTVAIIIMNWFQAAHPALLYVAPCVIGLIAIHWLWNGELEQDGTNQLMGKLWNWNMYGTKLKKFVGWVLHTTNEDDAVALPEDHEGGPEDGYGGEEDATDPLEDDDGDQDDHGAASEDRDDSIVPFGRRAVQVLAIRANFHVCAINGYDWQIGRCIYRQHEREVQEEGMVDLVPIGPCGVLMAYGAFTLEVFYSITRASNTTTTGNEGSGVCGAPIRVEWDVCGEDDDIEPEEYTRTIWCRGPGRKLEITYLVIPNAIETNVEVKLKLKDLGSRSCTVYGKIKASTADYGNRSVHLFSCERGRSWSVPSGPMSILPLSPAVIALPYRRQLELHIEVDLIVITIFDNQEEYKNLKFSLTFTRGIRSQEREVDDDQVEVSIAFDPEI